MLHFSTFVHRLDPASRQPLQINRKNGQRVIDVTANVVDRPLGFIGVIWMLLLTHTTLSIISFMGVVSMIGIVVSNGILLVVYANKLQERGLPFYEAVVRAGRTRLRPS